MPATSASWNPRIVSSPLHGPRSKTKIRARFDEWKIASYQAATQHEQITSSPSPLLRQQPARHALPSPSHTLLRRLPADFTPRSPLGIRSSLQRSIPCSDLRPIADFTAPRRRPRFARSRAMPFTSFLKSLARLRATIDWAAARAALSHAAAPHRRSDSRRRHASRPMQIHRRPRSRHRASGIPRPASVTGFSRRTSMPQAKPPGPALSPAICASVRVDRVFRAGLEPLSEGDRCLVDHRLQDRPRRRSRPRRRRCLDCARLCAAARELTPQSCATCTARTVPHPRRPLLSPHVIVRLVGSRTALVTPALR